MVIGLRFAAIDIGSNAIRLLFSRVINNNKEKPIFIKESLIRMPLRLGHDAFNYGKITGKNRNNFLHTLIGFSHLIDAYSPVAFRACATAAMRNVSNGKDLVKNIEVETGIHIDIISGAEESRLVLSKNIMEYLNPRKNYIHIDVGGGSTELTIFTKNKRKESKSFSIGTVRILEGKVKDSDWINMKLWIGERTKSFNSITAIGSGGNINKIASMLSKSKGKSILIYDIENLIAEISKESIDDRIILLGLRPDRADVIEYASEIYINCMKWSGAEKIIVPQSGLADGIVSDLYQKYNTR